MSFTSLAIIRKHLLTIETGQLVFENEPITLNGLDVTALPHGNLVPGSGVVKWDTDPLPQMVGPIVLNGVEKASAGVTRLVPGSVVVALSDAMVTVYMEELDYRVDYRAGLLYRVTDGHIPDSQPVYVFYSHYTAFDANNDFEFDYSNGTVKRRNGSSIPDGATLLVDYTLEAGSITDDLILQAIAEVDDVIVRTLSTDYNSSSTDQGLQTGATQLVLAIITRDLATDALTRRLTSDAASRAKEWQNLSALYESSAWQTLRPYLDRYAVHTPERRPNA